MMDYVKKTWGAVGNEIVGVGKAMELWHPDLDNTKKSLTNEESRTML